MIPLDVEERLVMYVDILGFSEMFEEMEKSDETNGWDQLVNTMSNWAQSLPNPRWKTETDAEPFESVEITTFSDSIVYSVSAKDLENAFTMVTYSARELTKFFAARGSPLRGGIAIGQQLHRGSLLLGPAMIEAYRLETEIARMPRIVISDGLRSRLTTSSRPWHQLFLKRDSDGACYYDVIQDLLDPNMVDGRENSTLLRLLIEKGLNHPRMAVRVKYRWLAERFNKALISTPDANLFRDLIVLPK